MSNNNSHYLRPVFTERIIQLLQNGRSINLIGAEGTGRKRLLEDIRDSKIPNTTIALVNMKTCYKRYDSLIRDVWEQWGNEGEKPDTLSELIERYEEKCEQRMWLFLDNFSALLDEPEVDQHYDTTFYDTLNYCRNKAHFALICVTEQPHNQSMIYIKGELAKNSWLDLEQKRLPSLSYEDIIHEVKRRSLPVMREERSALIAAVREHKKPYKLLTCLTDNILNREDAHLPFQKRLQQWIKDFDKQEKAGILTKKRAYHVKKEVRAWSELTGMNKLKTPFLVIQDIAGFIRNKLGGSK